MKKTNQEMKKLLSEYKSSSKKHEKMFESVVNLQAINFMNCKNELRRNEENASRRRISK